MKPARKPVAEMAENRRYSISSAYAGMADLRHRSASFRENTRRCDVAESCRCENDRLRSVRRFARALIVAGVVVQIIAFVAMKAGL